MTPVNPLVINTTTQLTSPTITPAVSGGLQPAILTDLLYTPQYNQGDMQVPTISGGIAIPLGALPSVGYAHLVNTDQNNWINILNAVSGATIIAKLPPKGGRALLYLGVAAPAAIAVGGPAQMQYFLTVGS